jgi:hypothetical protein
MYSSREVAQYWYMYSSYTILIHVQQYSSCTILIHVQQLHNIDTCTAVQQLHNIDTCTMCKFVWKLTLFKMPWKWWYPFVVDCKLSASPTGSLFSKHLLFSDPNCIPAPSVESCLFGVRYETEGAGHNLGQKAGDVCWTRNQLGKQIICSQQQTGTIIFKAF